MRPGGVRGTSSSTETELALSVTQKVGRREIDAQSGPSVIDPLMISLYHHGTSGQRFVVAQMIQTRRIGTEVLVRVLAGLSVVVCVWQEVEARDLFAPKEQATTEAD